MTQTIPSFCGHCGHCGHYLRPDEGHAEIIGVELVMLCDSCKSVMDSKNAYLSYQNQQPAKTGGPIWGNVQLTENNHGQALLVEVE